MKENQYLKVFCEEVSRITGQTITEEHVHSAIPWSRYYYVQAPEKGSPMLLHHYRGPFFVDLHPEDYKAIEKGEISPQEYIHSANWQVGYFWGGGSMIGGGYYQPMDLISQQEEVRNYLTELACRGAYRSSGCKPKDERCSSCQAKKNCFFWKGEAEPREYDPRLELFQALRQRLEKEVPGYTLQGFICDAGEKETIVLQPNCRFESEDKFSFLAIASEKVIRDLLMRKVAPKDWDEYAQSFKFKVPFEGKLLDIKEVNLRKIFKKKDFSNESLFEKISNLFKR